MRVILDSNVSVAGVADRGLRKHLLELRPDDHDLIVSDELLDRRSDRLVGW
jgi:hypothetical protein